VLAGGRRLAIGSWRWCSPTDRVVPGEAGTNHGRAVRSRSGGVRAPAAGRRHRRGRSVRGWPVVQPDLVRFCWSSRPSTPLHRDLGRWWRAPARLRPVLAHRARRNTRGGTAATSWRTTTWETTSTAVPRRDRTYSSAVFASPSSRSRTRSGTSTPDGGGAGLSGGERVLEIGSGGAGLRLYAAGSGVPVTRSPSHIPAALAPSASGGGAGAPRRRAAEGLPGGLRPWDAIVSIEMLEAVGPSTTRVLRRLRRALAPGGG